MRLYETRTQRIVDFEVPDGPVRMYTCGITPYDATHVGHAATFLTFDVLQRRLRDRGHETRCVRNITDVDDSILARAAQLGVHYLDLAASALATFEADMDALGLLRPWREPRATSAISDVRSFIGSVLGSGHAYEAEGSVFFDVSSSDCFGQVSGLDSKAMANVQAGEVDRPGRRNPLDFVLWHPSGHGEPSWDSRWGPGRPGWHVECSALALRELGPVIDLHGGGSDLVYPHHECENAQSEAVTGGGFVRHWMHVAMVQSDGEKMAKSAGNLVFISDLRKLHDPMAIRLALSSSHYRSGWDWSQDHVSDAESRLATWRATGEGAGGLDEVRHALDDDLDTPGAIAAIDSAAASGEGVRQSMRLLGVS